MRLLRAVVRVIGAACLVWRLEQRLPMDELAEELRRVAARRPVDLRSASLEAQVLGRLLPLLPPWRMGPCIKRSLVLLRLWALHGVRAELCLGSRAMAGGRRGGHAWLEVADLGLRDLAGRPAGEAVVIL